MDPEEWMLLDELAVRLNRSRSALAAMLVRTAAAQLISQPPREKAS